MHLVTKSLLDAFSFYRSYEGENEDRVRQEFLNTLSRTKFEPNEAMKKGIEFEDKIRAYCDGASDTGLIAEIGDVCKGGYWQEAVKKPLGNFLLYGKADVIKQDTIYDIKYSGSYDLGKFHKSAQHRIYLYCTGMPKFSYLVSDGKSYWREDYSNHGEIENELKEMLYDFTGHLKHDPVASDLYYTKWRSYGPA